MSKKTWSVTAAVAGGKYIGDFEAETGEEAIAMAAGSASVDLCHQCASECENAECEWMTAECDGETVTTEETWQDKALAAGWTPPKAKKGKAK